MSQSKRAGKKSGKYKIQAARFLARKDRNVRKSSHGKFQNVKELVEHQERQ